MSSLVVDIRNEEAVIPPQPAVTDGSRLSPEDLYTRCELEFDAETSADLPDVEEPPGQQRAIDSIRFGIGIRRPGYNLFVIGPRGAGRLTLVKSLLQQRAVTEAVPSDCCYVQNFEDSSRPHLLLIPAGTGVRLRADLEYLTQELCSAAPAVFESDDYRKRRQIIEDEVKTRREQALAKFRERSEAHGFAFAETATGFVFAPKHGDEILDHEGFHKLPKEEQQHLEKVTDMLRDELLEIMREIPKWEGEARAKVRTLDRELTSNAVQHLIDDLRSRYRDIPQVIAYLDALQKDLIEHAGEFLQQPEESAAVATLLGGDDLPRRRAFRRYRVNVLVSHAEQKGAPVVVEENPTYANLIGQIDYLAHLGALVTDFHLIKPGALHRASGGYLVLDARRVLMQPFAWDALKRALRLSQVRIESLASLLGVTTTATLQPEPFPLEVKVALVGDPFLYDLLSTLDPEFHDLFKVAAQFDNRMDRNRENQIDLARMIATTARREGLLPFDRPAMRRVIEQCARQASHGNKLSTNLANLADLLRESDYWAREVKHHCVTAEHVRLAIERSRYRLEFWRERLAEEIQLGTILIDTDGERVGQVNGISVFQFGECLFGHPARITATVGLGSGQVVDIERESKLGGPIHSKGVFILSGFLAGKYAADFPLSLSASIVFEQTYTEIEGDSASSAELYALLSAVSGIPIRQSFAVTGSVNQYGQIQAIGAVNEKIEGFFDLCKARGLTGRQGVVIPRANVQHLMLRSDLIDAVAKGQFHIHAVSTIDEGLEVLTGISAGACERGGIYPVGTINSMLQTRLAIMAQTRMAYGPTMTQGGER